MLLAGLIGKFAHIIFEKIGTIMKTYLKPEAVTIRIWSCGYLCQSGYLANDVYFGFGGEAGLSIGDDDVNWGGSF